LNRVAKTLLNVMRIEVLLAVGLVLWIFSLEAKALDLTCFYDKDGVNEIQEFIGLGPNQPTYEKVL